MFFMLTSSPSSPVITKYPSFEVRKPRADFTRKLEKICTLLDTRSVDTVAFKSYPPPRMFEVEVEIEALWVFGSYARGAKDCGDLDIMVKVNGYHPRCTEINRHFLGKLPGVRVYLGTPTENTSGVKIKDARLIWQKDLDWKGAIDAIAEDPNATRFPRRSDEIILRSEQTGLYPDDVASLLDDCEAGHYRQRFIPLDQLADEPRHGAYIEWLCRVHDRSGAKLKALLPYLSVLFETLSLRFEICKIDGRIWASKNRKTILYLGDGECRWDYWLEKVNPYYPADRVIIMPALNTRGPNGALVIEKGPKWRRRKVLRNRFDENNA